MVLLLVAAPADAQVRLHDLVFTGGFSVEGYDGNFSAVTVPIVDSTDHATAAVGEFGTRGELRLVDDLADPSAPRLLALRFDAGLRQFAAAGFELRDYAPREWVGRMDLTWWQQLGRVGALTVGGTVRGRTVEDRPPMPLFLQPGYVTARGAVGFRTRPIQNVSLDIEFVGETADYEGIPELPQLDLLDRRDVGVELGAETGSGVWRLRFRGALRNTEYAQQASFEPDDPFRRDRTVEIGARWRLDDPGRLNAVLGVEGILNRSNSKRPEYDAVSVEGSLALPLPWWRLGVNLYGVLTAKSYVHETPFDRLVPGEEADNASLLYLDLNRPLVPGLDGALRFGWTRAETDIGESYYSRFGVSVLLNYRPRL
jgi:hypothetical protein